MFSSVWNDKSFTNINSSADGRNTYRGQIDTNRSVLFDYCNMIYLSLSRLITFIAIHSDGITLIKYTKEIVLCICDILIAIVGFKFKFQKVY